ncbi:MAG: hypothetical protein K8T90_13435 [Planctomycetes bacterium]|nr:hypothetical protein [Planctomycetota bacterium]
MTENPLSRGPDDRVPRADIILNPISGSSRAAASLALFRAELERGGYQVRLRPTERAGHAPDLAFEAAADGAAVVVAAGGDGTLNEVASGLLRAGPGAPPLAVLARGTSNLVAREFGVPFDPVGAARVLLGGTVRTMDTVGIRAAGSSGPITKTMLACAGAGWDAHVVAALAAKRKGHIQVSTWFGPIASALRDYDFPVFRVDAPGEPPREAVLALFLNCRPYAKFFTPAPAALPGDGLLDAVLIAPDGRSHLPRIAWRAWRRTLAADPCVTVVRATSFRVASERAVPLQVDGDPAGATPADLIVRPATLRILVPGPDHRGRQG